MRCIQIDKKYLFFACFYVRAILVPLLPIAHYLRAICLRPSLCKLDIIDFLFYLLLQKLQYVC